MTGGIAVVMSRISELDARLQALDPVSSGPGFGGPGFGGPGFGEVLAGFAAGGPGGIVQAGGLGAVALSGFAGGQPAAPPEPSTALVAPVPGARLTQDFGPTSFSLEPSAVVDGTRYAHFHDGLDLAAPLGETVRAAADGAVISAGRLADGAVAVKIRHIDGSETFYAHLAPGLEVRAGDAVRAGQIIGRVGMTGNTTGPHLHFELRSNGRTVDPAPWLQAGRLPGAGALAGRPGATSTPGALARFDAVAGQIPFAAEIRAAATDAGIGPLLLASMVRAESGFRPAAVSSAGAQGLTQLMPATSRSLMVTDPFDPVENLRGGARYLAGNLRIYGRVDLALAAYQAGKGAVARAGGIPDSPTTHRYIDRILSYWAGYLDEAS